jgi:ABC-2 type transport system permease protein
VSETAAEGKDAMLRSIWSKTLRDYRIATLSWGIGLGLTIFLTLVYYSITNEAARAAEAEYARSLRFLGEPVALTTPGGYTTWHTLGLLPLVLGIWTVLAGARLVRGEEERGVLDVTLSMPIGRPRALAEKLIALIIALTLIALIIGLGTALGQIGAGLALDIGAALLVGMNISLAAFVFGMVALLLSQFVRRRAVAAGFGGALMLLAYLVDGTGRTINHGEWLQRLSPLYYYDLSKPLIPSYGVNVGALLLLLAVGLAITITSVLLFAQRDIGGVAFAFRHERVTQRRLAAGGPGLERARRDIFVRTVSLRALRAEALGTVWWLVGLIAYASWTTLLARTAKDNLNRILQGTPGMAQLFAGYNVNSDAGFVALVVFIYLPIIIVLFALTLAISWPSELDSGRMELGVSVPQSRWRIILERYVAVAVAALSAPLVMFLAVWASALIAGLSINAGTLAIAMIGLIPLELVTASVVFLLAGWLRTGAIAAIIGIAVGVSYFADLLNPLLKLPDWLIGLSIFHQYGSPLIENARWGAWLALTVIAAAVLAAAIIRFSRSDLRGAT